jgi:hypothetical protein
VRARVLLLAALASVAVVAASAPAATSTARFRVAYAQPRSKAEESYVELLKASQLSQVMAELSKTLILKRDITIYVAGGVPGPEYFPDRSVITFPHEFSDLLRRFILARYPNIKPYDFGVGFASLEYFVLFHEIGHALVHQWQLPVLGREEDAVDAFSTIFMTQFVPNGGQIALWAAELFDVLAGGGKGAQSVRVSLQQFADEHSLDEQRAYSIVCWVYGSNPQRYSRLATIPGLKERLPRCAGEYAQLKRSWLTLLRPHIRHS